MEKLKFTFHPQEEDRKKGVAGSSFCWAVMCGQNNGTCTVHSLTRRTGLRPPKWPTHQTRFGDGAASARRRDTGDAVRDPGQGRVDFCVHGRRRASLSVKTRRGGEITQRRIGDEMRTAPLLLKVKSRGRGGKFLKVSGAAGMFMK